jgi:hypothetical protein
MESKYEMLPCGLMATFCAKALAAKRKTAAQVILGILIVLFLGFQKAENGCLFRFTRVFRVIPEHNQLFIKWLYAAKIGILNYIIPIE